jgi:selenocysteine-specific elongation factor
MVLTLPGAYPATTRLDVRLECWRRAARALRHAMAVDIFVGAAVVPARVRFLAGDSLEPGEVGWAQLALAQPVAAAPGDRFIARNPSPSETLGGGVVLDTQPRQHRRSQPEVVAHLQALAADEPVARVRAVVQGAPRRNEPLALGGIARRTRCDPANVTMALEQLQADGEILRIGDSVMATTRWQAICQLARGNLTDYHRRYPLRIGMPLQEWRSLTRIEDALAARLVADNVVAVRRRPQGGRAIALVALPEFAPQLTAAQGAQRNALIARLQADEMNPPAASELARLAHSEVIAAAIDAGDLIRVAPDLVLLAAAVTRWQAQISAHLATHARMTVADARAILGGSRRIIVPLLEYWDSRQITRRVGDVRVRGAAAMRAGPDDATEPE